VARRVLKCVLDLLALGIIAMPIALNLRPSLATYAHLAMTPAHPGAAIQVRFAGVSTLVFDDGETVWMTDGFFSRPSFFRLLLSQIEPDQAAIERGLKSLEVTKLAVVVTLHSHYDHAMDAPLVAMQTEALLVGSESTLNVGRGLGMPEDRMRKVRPRETITLGKWKLTFIESRHAPSPLTESGVVTIDARLVPPARVEAWGEGQTWAIFVEHTSGARILILGSAGFEPGSLHGMHADMVFLSIGRLSKQADAYRSQWWEENVRRVGARLIIPIHWDDFGLPLEEPFVAFPYVVDDIEATMAEISTWAERDGINLRMPLQLIPFAP
jgi:L-ascorbate metabolism protein UlaG (beta-lactamase superfamily)